MISIIFVAGEIKELFSRLEKIFSNLETKMTKERYLKMCDQMGMEPKVDEIPPGWDDLPELAQHAINIFNQLGDRVYPEIGYMGKDYTNLCILMDIHGIEEHKELVLDILTWLDNRAIKQSSEKIKRELDKIKNKGKGNTSLPRG